MISRADYNELYFRGGNSKNQHIAGYTNLSRIPIDDLDDPNHQGEAIKTFHRNLYVDHIEIFDKKRVLFLGSALGFEVTDFRSFGVDAKGVEWSDWAYQNTESQEFIINQDALTYLLTNLINFDTIVGLRFPPCLSDIQINSLALLLNNSGKNLLFTVDDTDSYTHSLIQAINGYYNIKTISQWRALFPSSTIRSITEARFRTVRG